MPFVRQLTIPEWLHLAPQVKAELKKIFDIPATGRRSFVQIGQVGHLESDGHSHADLARITLESMAEYLGEPVGDDFGREFVKVVAKIEEALAPKLPESITNPENVARETNPAPVSDSVSAPVPAPKRGRPKKVQADNQA